MSEGWSSKGEPGVNAEGISEKKWPSQQRSIQSCEPTRFDSTTLPLFSFLDFLVASRRPLIVGGRAVARGVIAGSVAGTGEVGLRRRERVEGAIWMSW